MSAKKDLALVVLNKVMVALASVMSIRISTTYLNQYEYGIFSLLVSLSTLASLIILNPVSQYINREINAWAESGTLIQKLKAFVLYAVVAGGAASIITIFWSGSQDFSVSYRARIAIIVFLFTTSVAINANFAWFLNMLGYRAASVRCTSIGAFGGLLSSTCLIFVSPSSVSWMCGQMFGALSGSVVGWVLLKKRVPIIDRAIKYQLDFGVVKSYLLSLSLATFLMWVVYSSYKVIVETGWGLHMLALLTVPFVVSAQIWAFVETIAMNFWFPIFYKKINAECLETKILALTDLINIIIPTYLIFLGCAFASSRLFFNIIVADAYRDLWIVLYLGLLFEFFRACTNVFAVGCQINCDLNILKIPYLIGSVFLLFFLAIGHYLTLNVEGVALIVTFASGIVVVAMVRSVHKIYQFKIEPMIWIVGIFFSCIGATTGVIMHSMRLTLPPSVLIVIIYFSIAFILIKNIKKNHGSINRLLSRTQEW